VRSGQNDERPEPRNARQEALEEVVLALVAIPLPRPLAKTSSVNKSLYWRSRGSTRHAGGHAACQVRRAGAGVHGAIPPRLGGHRSPFDRLRRHRLGGAATGMAKSTIQRGLRDLQVRRPLPPSRSRLAGGGCKRATVTTRCSCGTWTHWWSPPPPTIRIRRFAGRAGACGRWRWHWTAGPSRQSYGGRGVAPRLRHGVPLSAGHEQVEQDRASPVLPHRDELARNTAREPRHDRESDWCDAQPIGAARSIRAGSRPLSRRRRGIGRPNGHGAPRTIASTVTGITRFIRFLHGDNEYLFPDGTFV
jgi:hypothetical protein